MNIGIRAHDFGKQSLETLVPKISNKNFTSIQLALAKALDGINSSLGCLSPGLAHYIGNEFKKNGLQIAVLGCYINPVDVNEEERKKALARFKEHIRFARDFGSSIVATETGSLNSDMSFTEENHGEKAFNRIVESVKELVDEAEKFGVLVGIEGVTKHTINTPERMKRLLDTVNSSNLQVVFDPVNFLDEKNYKDQDAIIKQAFELFGDRIVAVHAKDFIIDNEVMKVVPAGKGLLNYNLVVNYLKHNKPFVNVLLEDIKVEYMDESLKFLKELNNKIE